MRVHYDADKNLKLDDKVDHYSQQIYNFFAASNLILPCCLYLGLPNHLFRSEISIRMILRLELMIPTYIKIKQKRR
jgi:hypothetical protein